MALADAVASAVGAWPFDEASGNALDQVGSIDLTDNNTVGAGSGPGTIAASRDFEDTNSEYFNHADNATLSTGDIDFCLRFLANPETVGGGNRFLLSKGVAATNLEFSFHQATGDNKWTWRVWNEALTVTDEVKWGTAPTAGVWYLIHVWHSAASNEIGIAVNAGTAVTASTTVTIVDNTGDFVVGRYAFSGSDYYDGLMADLVFLKNYILSAAERSEDYNSGDPIPFANWDAGAAVLKGGLALCGVGR